MRPIDADNLISVLDILSDKGGDIRYWEQLKWIVADCPTADVQEVKYGRWVKLYECNYKCSVCGAWFRTRDDYGNPEDKLPDYRYCPMCGAKVDEVGE